VGLVALAINLTVPPAVILLEMGAATKHQQGTTNPSKSSAVVTGLNLHEITTPMGSNPLESLLSSRASTCQRWWLAASN
jgi:hypothetical protein